MATYTLSTLPSSLKKDDIINVSYTGGVQSISLKKGTYKFECWGARGGSVPGSTYGGLGGYVSGTLEIKSDTTYYLFVGGVGKDSSSTSVDGSSGTGGAGGYNGGGTGGGSRGPGGGGCSAITNSSTMSTSASLLVAAGGGACVNSSYTSTANARTYETSNVTSTYAGGNGATGYTGCYPYDTCGGGGGYYGGTSITADDSTHAYGGVNYISNIFISPSSLAGGSVSSRPSSTNGYIRITVIKAGLPLYIKTDSSTYSQIQTAYIKSGNSWIELTDS